MKKITVLFLCCLLLTSCGRKDAPRAVELGSPCYVMKTLDGLFSLRVTTFF